MGLKRKNADEYIKINKFDKTTNTVNIITYKSYRDRDNEKLFKKPIENCLSEIRQYSITLQEEFLQIMEENNFNRKELSEYISLDEDLILKRDEITKIKNELLSISRYSVEDNEERLENLKYVFEYFINNVDDCNNETDVKELLKKAFPSRVGYGELRFFEEIGNKKIKDVYKLLKKENVVDAVDY